MKTSSIKGSALILALTSVLVTGGMCVNSYAGSTSANLSVSATVIANITVVSQPAVFHTVDVTKKEATATSPLAIHLSSGVTASISLSQGTHPQVTSTDAVPQRQMVSSNGDKLDYIILQDTGTTVWGNTNDTSKAYVGTGLNEDLMVNFKIIGGQNAPAGTYTDTVVATIKF